MAWPPPVLPIDRGNALPMQDTHPQDHNSANLAINDIVAKLQSLDVGIMAGFGVVSGTANVSVVSGVSTVMLGVTFQSPPTIVMSNGNGQIPQIPALTTGGVDRFGAYSFAFLSPPGPVANGVYAISWVAIGKRA